MDRPIFKAFLSHRYQSVQTNLYFYDLLNEHAEVQFEVDVGTKATNVTRLERLVRDADAFIGFYTLPADVDGDDVENAVKASRYFRLELDLAARARRPALLFVDKRYRNVIAPPPNVVELRYDHREIGERGRSRRHREFSEVVQAFCRQAAAACETEGVQPGAGTRDQVGILLPERAAVPTGFPPEQIAAIEESLDARGITPVRFRWGAPCDRGFLRALGKLDWMLTDVSEDSCTSGMPGFLHGYFVPQMRFTRPTQPQGAPRPSPLEQTLLAPFEVGYPKDIARCDADDSLGREFRARLATLSEPRRLVGTPAEAVAYFESAALRKETVFLSYSGDDRDFAASLVAALKRRFQAVFDYRDQGESLPPGGRWIDDLFAKLSTSALGIMLLTPSYFRSGNCEHEAQALVALADQRKLRLLPVKRHPEELATPPYLAQIQYLRAWEYGGTDQLADKIVEAFAASSANSAR